MHFAENGIARLLFPQSIHISFPSPSFHERERVPAPSIHIFLVQLIAYLSRTFAIGKCVFTFGLKFAKFDQIFYSCFSNKHFRGGIPYRQKRERGNACCLFGMELRRPRPVSETTGEESNCISHFPPATKLCTEYFFRIENTTVF